MLGQQSGVVLIIFGIIYAAGEQVYILAENHIRNAHLAGISLQAPDIEVAALLAAGSRREGVVEIVVHVEFFGKLIAGLLGGVGGGKHIGHGRDSVGRGDAGLAGVCRAAEHGGRRGAVIVAYLNLRGLGKGERGDFGSRVESEQRHRFKLRVGVNHYIISGVGLHIAVAFGIDERSPVGRACAVVVHRAAQIEEAA